MGEAAAGACDAAGVAEVGRAAGIPGAWETAPSVDDVIERMLLV